MVLELGTLVWLRANKQSRSLRPPQAGCLQRRLMIASSIFAAERDGEWCGRREQVWQTVHAGGLKTV